jgi:RNA polymerase sigma-70 factor (ECF subfamily)
MTQKATIPQDPAAAQPKDLERYRSYLAVLAHAHVDPGLRGRVDLSGVVQQTFLEAHLKMAEFHGSGAPEMGGWLRRILANNLADALRGLGRAKRDVGRERSLERDLEESSARLGDWLAAEQSSPSQRAQREERAVLLAGALAGLPEPQREVVLLRHWHGWTLSQIAEHLGRTPPSIVGLLQRGLKALRERLHSHRQRGEL